jgi:hypothetical protein
MRAFMTGTAGSSGHLASGQVFYIKVLMSKDATFTGQLGARDSERMATGRLADARVGGVLFPAPRVEPPRPLPVCIMLLISEAEVKDGGRGSRDS